MRQSTMNLPSSYACITLFLCALIQAVAGFNFQVPKTNCLHHIPKPAAEFTFLTTSTRTNNNLNANRQIHKLNLHPRIRGASVTKLNSSNQDESSKSPPAVSSKQAFVYRISSILYLLSSLTIFIMPNRFEPTLLNRYPLHKVAGGTGFALAAGISLLLQTNDGTSSSSPQTMKKLNFGLAAFSFIGLFAIPGEASFHPSFQGAVGAFGIMTLARVVGGLVAGSRWLDCNVIVPFLSKKVDASSTGTAGGISGLFAECKRGIRETWFSEDSIDVSVPVDQDVNKGKRKSKKKSIFSLFYLWAIVGIVSNAISFYHSVKVRLYNEQCCSLFQCTMKCVGLMLTMMLLLVLVGPHVHSIQ
jgi:hypothetical protein